MTKRIVKRLIVIAGITILSIFIISYLMLWKKVVSDAPMNRALQNQVDYLESEVVELKEIKEDEEQLSNAENLEGEECNEEKEEEVTANEDNGKSEGEGRNLQELISSKEPEDWLEAAKRPEATEEQLIIIAEKAANISCYDTHSQDREMQLKIANAISENSSTTENVLKEFAESRFEEVSRFGRQASLETMIASSYPEDWLEAAKRPEATEEQLIRIAEKAARLSCYNTYSQDIEMQLKIANELIANSNTTKRVIEEFKDSRYPEVVEFAEEWLSSH